MAVLLVFGMIGCATNNVLRYDTNSPPEQDCTIVLKGGHVSLEVTKITAFDDKPVDWRSKQTGLPMVGDYKIKYQ
ncbi:MAG: hypothetical protein Ta2G_08920 [Termitinemataceae bacterium]|nr:MAG: hypothetical protein Ta2G_08920 [Termitinemataceae bacterium]